MPSAYNSLSANSTASNPDPSVPKVPFISARIFYSSFTYSFPFSPGLKFIRLYFHPASYSGLNPSKAYFSVTCGHYTLLFNFNPTTAANALNSPYFTKEFSINIKEKMLNITFIPSHTISNSFAFVNGVEIFSIPLNFYIPGRKVPLPFIGQQEPFFIHDETALQMLYWVNVGYDSVFRYDHVVTSIFGNWLIDFSYIFSSAHGTSITAIIQDIVNYNCTKSAAPKELYTSARIMGTNDAVNMNYNLTWTFTVDSGFEYLVRLHFCEISFQVTEVNQRVFRVYINNQTAEESLDIIALTGAPFVPAHKDYVVTVPGGPKKKQEYLWLALHPNTKSKPRYADAILNGIEIIKLSDRNNNLAAHIQINNEETGKVRKKFITGGVVGGLGLFFVCFVAFGLWKRMKVSNTVELMNANVLSIGSSDLCRQFSLAEIKAATNNFNEALVIGSGGFGKVYKGFIDAGTAQVAVKRGSPKSQQGVREFQNEIELLSKFRHMHLVSLIGYCQEGGEMILVYEYMAGGTLRDHLYKSQKQPLEWKLRLKICIDAARGLHHLHTGSKYSIIHRDVKTANILLDDKWMAKVSDFGLSRVGAITASRGHVSTVVKGTFGYMDPEYYRCQKLTVKSDVYSFGVVLFEVLCGRPAVKPIGVVVLDEDEDERVCLADWARHCHQTRTIDRMIDPCLRGKIAPECLMVFVDVAVKCLADKGIERPSMSDVLGNLEHALQLQEISESDGRSTV